MTTGWRSRLPTVSLRELLAIIAFLAVACAAITHVTERWVTILASVTVLLGGVTLILAFVERGITQAFAAGFMAFAVSYAMGVYCTPPPTHSGPMHFGPERVTCRGCLPTSALLANVWWHVRRPYYYENFTPMEPYDGPMEDIARSRMDPSFVKKGPTNLGTPNGVIFWNLNYYPMFETFIRFGHWLFALAFGDFGGKLAVWVYTRRIAREQTATESKPT